MPNSVPGSVLTYTLKEPVGVVAGIWKLAPALAAGAVILKPAEEAGPAALRIGELITEIGAPAGMVNVLTEHPGVDKVAFTGSTEVGRRVVRTATGNLKRVTLKLGGKSPDIVFADANLDQAVPGAAMGSSSNGRCTTSSSPAPSSSRSAVACVLPFDTVDEVVTRADDSEYGLAGGIWTRDVGTAHRLAGRWACSRWTATST